MDIAAAVAAQRELATSLFNQLRRDGLKRGIVTVCIGGGQGIALAIESVQ